MAMFQRTSRRLKKLADGFPTNFHEFQPSYKPRQHPDPPTTVITKSALQEFYPNEKALEFATARKVMFPGALRLVPGQKFQQFPIRISICNKHVFSFYHMKYLDQFEHPLTDKILHFYDQQKKTRSLWSYVHGSSTTDGSPAVVRQTSERVVRAALFRALNAAGYDASGKSADGKMTDLKGTIRVGVSQPKDIMKVDFETLVEYLTKLVAAAVPRLHGQVKVYAPKKESAT
jgi:hypothetical protein